MWEQIKRFFRILANIFVTSAENQLGDRALLEDARRERGKSVTQMNETVDDVGTWAEKARDDLANAMRRRDDFLQAAEDALRDAQKAKSINQLELHDRKMEEANSLANQSAEESEYVASIEQDLKDALKEHGEALEMVLREARELKDQERTDERLLGRKGMAKAKEARQRSREKILSLIPKDTAADVRARIESQTEGIDQRNRARQIRLDAYFAAENAQKRTEASRQTAASAKILAGLKAKAGYVEDKPVNDTSDAEDLAKKIAAMKKE